MTKIVTVDASGEQSCEALGHPTECTEPAPGSVVEATAGSVSITNASGQFQQVASVANADMNFPSHAHDYTAVEGCHQMGSHTLDPDVTAPSLSINGSPIYIDGNAVGTDPTTGGDINIVQAGINNSITYTTA